MTQPVRGKTGTTTRGALRRSLIALALIPAVLFTACSPGSKQADREKPQVLTTFTVLADMAQQVGGEYIDVQSLTKAGAEIHDYDPTPSDVRKAADADLILANGLNLEAWLDQFLQDSQARSVTVSQGIDPINISEDAGAGKPNPHAWMSPLAAQTYVDNIAEAFSQLDPQHASAFQDKARAYKEQLNEVHQELVTGLADLPENQRLLVTCEGAFSYLAADANLKEAYLWAVNSEGETGSRRVTEIVNTVEENRVPAVFCESTVPTSSMEQVAAESGATYAGELYVDSLSEEGGPVPTYLDLIRYDTRLIADSLGKTGR